MTRVLLDEGVPRHLADPLTAAGFSASSYPNSWKQITNGDFLTLAEKQGFDVLVTNDKNMSTQQNLRGRRIALIVLPTNLRRQVMELAPKVVNAIRRVQAGQCIIIEPNKPGFPAHSHTAGLACSSLSGAPLSLPLASCATSAVCGRLGWARAGVSAALSSRRDEPSNRAFSSIDSDR